MNKIISKVFFALFTVLVVSCGSNGGSNSTKNEITNAPMKYTVSVDKDFLFIVNGHDYTHGASFKVFECADNGDKIYQNDFIVEEGSSKTFTAQAHVQKVKVYVTMGNPLGKIGEEFGGWLPLVYYLSPNESKQISIDNHVELHRSEP